ncbi:hypothetical protein ACE38W_12275 [Chitinophaga sp. Hz27]|uniref:hypothetical protein n=1 Tax=Chitinophaga sp. Hz27 TaxID=3347169 RepID=UPI0035E326C5
MKTLALLISLSLFGAQATLAQESPSRYYKLYNQAVIFERIYAADSINKTELLNLLQVAIPKIPGFINYRVNGDIITGRIINGLVDYKRFGHSLVGTPLLIMDPYNAAVTIEVKDGKYRVTLSSIVFNSQVGTVKEMNRMDDYVANKDKTLWKTGNSAQKILKYTDEYFSAIFTLPTDARW